MAADKPPRKIPVLFDFDWTRPEGMATYDPETGRLTMDVRPGSRVAEVLGGTSAEAELRTLSFGYTLVRANLCLTRHDAGPYDTKQTHSCDLNAGHEGLPHHCPACGKNWRVQTDA